MKVFQKVFASFLSMALLLSCMPVVPAMAAVDRTCGENLTWTLFDGVLTISGTGPMYDYGNGDQPWAAEDEDLYSITTVVIEPGVTAVGDSAFEGCDELTSVTIPDGVTSIGYGAFVYCSLESVTLPDSLRIIEEAAFFECDNLRSVDIPDGVQAIGIGTFSGCENLTTVHIPESVTTVGEGAFWSCTDLTNVYYGGTEAQWAEVLIDNENEALLNATVHFAKTEPVVTGLFMVQYGKTQYTQGEQLDTSGLELIAIYSDDTNVKVADFTVSGYDPDTVGEQIITVAFGGMTITYTVTVIPRPSTVTASGTCGENLVWVLTDDGKLAISGSGNMSDYTASTQPWANYRDSITDVSVAAGITYIGSHAFCGCTNLGSVSIPVGMLGLGSSAFADCISLQGITLPDGLNTVGDYTFSNCSSLESVTIPDSVLSLGYRSFAYCEALKNISIGSGVEDIGDAAFYNCENLQAVRIPDRVSAVGDHTFAGCTNLESVLMGKAVAHIGEFAFSRCAALRNIDITDGVTTIGYCAFSSSGLRSISIPPSVKSIEHMAFDLCLLLSAVYISDLAAWCKINFESDCANPLSYANNLYLDGERIADLVIPEGVTSVNKYAFYRCTALNSVVLPAGLTQIGYHAFSECSEIQNVHIPKSVSTISGYAFYNDKNLVNIYYEGTKVQWDQVDIGTGNAPLIAAALHTVEVLTGFLITAPAKTEYWLGEALDTTGLIVTATYSDGSLETVNGGYEISGFDSKTPGEQIVEVAYQGFAAEFTVTVKEMGKVSVSGTSGIVGKTAEVTLTLANNPGITAMRMNVNYDSAVLTLAEVVDGGILGDAAHKLELVDPYTLCWVNDLATENFTEDGILVTLRFTVAEDAPEGVYPVTVSYDAGNFDIMDKDMNEVPLKIVNGSVEVLPVLLGDVNGDRQVDTRDRAMLTRYLSAWEEYQQIDLTAADVDQNGIVNTRDRVILTRYLADWEGYRELPYIA